MFICKVIIPKALKIHFFLSLSLSGKIENNNTQSKGKGTP